MHTALLNALPTMFLEHPYMPMHNNPTEMEIRDGVVTKCNMHLQIATPAG